MTRIVRGLLGVATAAALALPAAAQGMPELPDSIKDDGVLRVGVKCDYPPSGYLTMSGEHVGIEVEMARQIAEYAFGSKDAIEFTCVTSANRVPTLVGNKVDLVIATMGINPSRAEVVAFSNPYAWGASSVIVPSDSDIESMSELEGKKVGLIKGAWQVPWFEKNMPNVEMVQLNTVGAILQAMMQGRIAAYAHDLNVQLALVQKNDKLRLLDDRYKIGVRGAAMRKGEDEWVAYVNAALARMADEGRFEGWLREYVEPELVETRMTFWDMSQAPEDALD